MLLSSTVSVSSLDACAWGILSWEALVKPLCALQRTLPSTVHYVILPKGPALVLSRAARAD